MLSKDVNFPLSYNHRNENFGIFDADKDSNKKKKKKKKQTQEEEAGGGGGRDV